MPGKTTWLTILGFVVAGIFTNLDRAMDIGFAFLNGTSIRRVAQAEDNLAMYEKHENHRPVHVGTVPLPDGSVVQCKPFADGDTKLTFEATDGTTKSIWVPFSKFTQVSGQGTAFAGVRRAHVVGQRCRKKLRTPNGKVFYQAYVQLSDSTCQLRITDPATGKVKKERIRCNQRCR